MGCCNNVKKNRPPLQPREGPYKKTNAYTMRASIQQILTIVLALLVVLIHSIFEVSPISKIGHPILIILLVINYNLLVVLIYIYIRITVFDPVDRFITQPELAEQSRNRNHRTQCTLCRSYVHEKSYHCKRCNRCTQDFDHHCVYLNNCIGSRNYAQFMALLLIYILFLLNNIAQAIWVFVVARNNSEISTAAFSEWLCIANIVLCFLQLLATGALLCFHCYISCCLDLTTIAFYQSNSSKSDDKDREAAMQESPYVFTGEPDINGKTQQYLN